MREWRVKFRLHRKRLWHPRSLSGTASWSVRVSRRHRMGSVTMKIWCVTENPRQNPAWHVSKATSSIAKIRIWRDHTNLLDRREKIDLANFVDVGVGQSWWNLLSSPTSSNDAFRSSFRWRSRCYENQKKEQSSWGWGISNSGRPEVTVEIVVEVSNNVFPFSLIRLDGAVIIEQSNESCWLGVEMALVDTVAAGLS